MTTINVTLPDDLNLFLEHQMKARGLDAPSDYVQLLISHAKQGSDLLESLLMEGLDSGPPIRFDDPWRESMRRRVNDSLNTGEP